MAVDTDMVLGLSSRRPWAIAVRLAFCSKKNMGAATAGSMKHTVPNAQRQLVAWKCSAILGPAKVVIMYGLDV